MTADGVHPRFRDVGDRDERGINEYVALHREQGRLALPAEEAWRWRGRWADWFGRTAPLVLEIGPGNGSFLAELAARNPAEDHVAVEIRFKRVVQCAKKLEAGGATANVVVCRYHAAYLDDLFEDASLDTIWVNHPDPWPKDRHEKNRLISRWFLEDAARLLRPGGELRIKSDTLYNVERAVSLLAAGPEGEPLPALPLEVLGRSDDVTTGPAPWPDDIETGYQKKFRLKGEPVYAVALRRT
ncbi:MAG: methyltransferase domain-containing protein [Myxococcota bacterium]